MYALLFKSVVIRTLINALLIFVLIGCSSSTSSQPNRSADIISVAASPTVATGLNQSQSVLSVNQGASFNIGSLNIQASAFACPMDDWLYQSQMSYSGGNVVLTGSNASYDAGSIANLVASIDKNDPSVLPNGFATTLAGFISPYVSPGDASSACYQKWEITNMGQDIVEVNQIALLYTANPQPNTYHYKLINICSLPIQAKSKICETGRGTGGGGYFYQFRLGSGRKGTAVSGQENQSPAIDPGATIIVELAVGPANAFDPNYIYTLMPQLTLSTLSQPQDLPQLTSKAVFVNRSLISCYQLQSDNTFLQMKDYAPLVAANVECV